MLISLVLFILTTPFIVENLQIFTPKAQTPTSIQTLAAFPGAEGWGALSKGGRGGRVIEVTNLNDSGPGSLRACAQASGPRVCVFRVGGVIRLQSAIDIRNPFITIAGQTAPGGIVLVGGPVVIGIDDTADNVILRHLRLRNVQPARNAGPNLFTQGSNVIVDHISSSWPLDDNIEIWLNYADEMPLENVTVQKSIISETLYPHSTGGGAGGAHIKDGRKVEVWRGVRNITYHHNLYAHNSHRNPRVSSLNTQIINNVVYNWRFRVGGTSLASSSDWINNYWKGGPEVRDSSDSALRQHVLHHEFASDYDTDLDPQTGKPYVASIYIAGNVCTPIGFTDPLADNWPLITTQQGPNIGGNLPREHQRLEPLPQPPMLVTIQSAVDAYNSVLADVGANAYLDSLGRWVPNLDSVDARVINDVLQGTGKVISSPDEVGGLPAMPSVAPYQDSDHDGMPDEWEIAHGLNPNGSMADAWIVDLDGVAMLDHFLNGTEPRL